MTLLDEGKGASHSCSNAAERSTGTVLLFFQYMLSELCHYFQVQNGAAMAIELNTTPVGKNGRTDADLLRSDASERR